VWLAKLQDDAEARYASIFLAVWAIFLENGLDCDVELYWWISSWVLILISAMPKFRRSFWVTFVPIESFVCVQQCPVHHGRERDVVRWITVGRQPRCAQTSF